jgi:hypothetical protein
LPQQPKTADRFMIRATLARVFKLGRSPQSRAVERAKRLARSTDPFTRAALARAASTPPELLYYLVRDADVMVRRAVAGNTNTPRQADIILAMDDDPEVRRLVAGKITNQLSHLSKESVQLWALTLQVLDSLAKDNLPEVRRLIAESGRTVEKVPSSIMTRLSRDLLADVAVPALEYMGKIRDADLVEIVTARPDQRIIGAEVRSARCWRIRKRSSRPRPSIRSSIARRRSKAGIQPWSRGLTCPIRQSCGWRPSSRTG